MRVTYRRGGTQLDLFLFIINSNKILAFDIAQWKAIETIYIAYLLLKKLITMTSNYE